MTIKPLAKLAIAGVLAVALGLGMAACGSASGDDSKVDVVAYSAPDTVYTDSLIPAFQKTSQGDGVKFSTSFGPSGDQSRAVESGQPADIVHLSLDPDVQRLVDAGLVDSDWNSSGPGAAYDGHVQDSVVVFVTRNGNPKNLQTWDDLVQPGVQVVTPNPFSSGGARWNLVAAYGAQIEQGKSTAEAEDYLKKLLANTVVQPASAGDALDTFSSGKGDVLLSYESDAIEAQNAGEKLDYVVPDQTILIETPLATLSDASTAAQDFANYLYSPDGQQAWADGGYRPVDKSVLAKNKDKFPTPPGLFTINDEGLGGWDKVTTTFFDENNGIVTKDEADLGVSTSG